MPSFGSVFRTATGFLKDGLSKFLRNGDHIRGAAKALDSLGVGGGRLGGMVNKGFSLARGAQQLLSKGPMGIADAAGRAIGRGVGGLIERTATKLGAPDDLAKRASQGIGQLGGSFLSQGLQRLLR